MAERPVEPASPDGSSPQARGFCTETIDDSQRRTSTEIAEAFVAARNWQPDPLEAEPRCQAMTTRLRDPGEIRQLLTQYREPTSEVLTGRQLGQFELLELLGGGGMGQVYKARHLRLGKIQAVKLLHDHRLIDAAAAARFQQEIRALGQLQHPNIVAAQHADEAEGLPFLVMDYVDGTTLSGLQREYAQRGEPFPVAMACDLIRQAALGLQYAHCHGVVHRDIKPGNIMVGQDGVVRVLDLGLARLSREPAASGAAEPLTAETQILGTLDFMAPEQLRDSRTVDERCDVYALGATLYFLLAGRVCFSTDRDGTLMGKVVRILSDRPTEIRDLRDDLPLELGEVIHTCLEKDPEKRSLSAGELAERLSKWSAAATPQEGGQLRHGDTVPLPESVDNERMPRSGKLSALGRRPGVISGLAALAIGAVIVFKLSTSSGEIVVEIDAKVDADAVAIRVTGDDQSRIITAVGGASITVEEGEYLVELQQNADRLTLDARAITVEPGRTTPLRVRLRDDVDAVKPDDIADGTSITLMGATDDELFRVATRKEITRVVIFEKEITVRGLASLAALPNLEVLHVFANSGVIDDRCIRVVSGLAGLKELHLQEIGTVALSPTALCPLANLERLTFLFFEHHGFSPSTLGGIATLPSLTRLDLRLPQLRDDAVFDELSKAAGPLQLVLYGTPVTNRGLRSIASIPRLTELHLHTGRFTAEGLACLSRHPYLVNLLIDGGHALSWKELPSGTVFSRVRSLSVARELCAECDFATVDLFPNLQHLALNRTTISELAAKRLSRLSTLEQLTLTNVIVTLDTMREIAQQLPRLRELAIHEHAYSGSDLESLRQALNGGTLTAD